MFVFTKIFPPDWYEVIFTLGFALVTRATCGSTSLGLPIVIVIIIFF